MTTPLKRFAASVIGFRNNPFQRTILRFGILFTATSAVIIIVFAAAANSNVVHYIEKAQRERTAIASRGFNADELIARHNRISEATSRDFQRAMIPAVIGVFILAGIGNYFLARTVLKPVKEAMQMRKRFSSDAAHDLRTPLAVMKTGIELALRANSANGVECRSVLQSNLEEVDRMTAIVENLLRCARDNRER